MSPCKRQLKRGAPMKEGLVNVMAESNMENITAGIINLQLDPLVVIMVCLAIRYRVHGRSVDVLIRLALTKKTI